MSKIKKNSTNKSGNKQANSRFINFYPQDHLICFVIRHPVTFEFKSNTSEQNFGT